jgi:hypothetical protein
MPVLMKYPTESVTSSYVKAGDLVRSCPTALIQSPEQLAGELPAGEAGLLPVTAGYRMVR